MVVGAVGAAGEALACLDHVRATRTLRTQFLAQPGFLLYRMQHAQGRPSGPGFSAHALPPGAPDARRTRRTPPRPERSRRRQAPPCAPVGPPSDREAAAPTEG